MFKHVKNAAEYAVLAYTAVIAVQGLAEFTGDAIDYLHKKTHRKK